MNEQRQERRPNPNPGKVPPHSIEAEKAVLGTVLATEDGIADAAVMLEVDDFFLPAHKEIFDAMLALHQRQRPCDLVTVGDELKSRGMIRRLEGGEVYLTELAAAITVTQQLQHWAGIVRAKSGLRRLIAACADAQSRAYASEDVAAVLDELALTTAKIGTGNAGKLTRVGELVAGVVEQVGKRSEARSNGTPLMGVRTGVTPFDEETMGFNAPDVVSIAADTSGGKTAAANQIAYLNCLDGGVSLIFNLEMMADQIAERELAHVGHVDSGNMRRGDLDFEQWKRLNGAASKLSEMPLYVEDSCYTLRDIFAKSRACRAKHRGKRLVIVVDFLQLVEERIAKGENRAAAVGRVAKGLKRLAKEVQAVVIVLSQLNREPGKQERRPDIRDLKESGDIEQACDAIILIFNPEKTRDGEVTWILAKMRNGGETKDYPAWFKGRHYEFVDPSMGSI